MSLPLLPPGDMRDAVSDMQSSLNADSPNVIPVKQLIAYVNRHWINKSSIVPERVETIALSQSREHRPWELPCGTATTNQDQPSQPVLIPNASPECHQGSHDRRRPTSQRNEDPPRKVQDENAEWMPDQGVSVAVWQHSVHAHQVPSK